MKYIPLSSLLLSEVISGNFPGNNNKNDLLSQNESKSQKFPKVAWWKFQSQTNYPIKSCKDYLILGLKKSTVPVTSCWLIAFNFHSRDALMPKISENVSNR